MKTITLTYDGSKYILRYTLKTIKKLADKGVGIDKVRNLSDEPWIMLDLFKGAFLAEHEGISPEKVEAIYASIPNKIGFLEKLAECYSEPLDALMDEPDEDSKGNANWETNW